MITNYEQKYKESEDESIRKALIHIVEGACSKYGIKYQEQEISEEKLLAWLEKQKEPEEDFGNFVEKLHVQFPEVSFAKLSRIAVRVKNWLEKQGKEEYALKSYEIIKRILAVGFMDFLDENKKEGKMCLSNMECEDIDDAFDKQDWDKLARYTQKYLK